MTIIVYKNSSPMNKAVKEKTQVDTFEGTLRDGTSLVNPHILVEKSTLPVFNYAYIEAFSRYYFVETIINVNNNLWEIVLHCDVLSTYWNSIKEADCIVCRSENKRLDKLIDNEIWTTVDSLYSTIDFPNNPFDSSANDIERYVLIVAGAGTAEKTNTTSVNYTPSTGNTVIGASISKNGISWDSSNSAFWIPTGYTGTWHFYEQTSIIGTTQLVNVAWDGTQWVFTPQT